MSADSPSISASALVPMRWRSAGNRDGLDVVRRDVGAAGGERVPAGAAHQRDRAARARAERDSGLAARRAHDRDGVVEDALVDLDHRRRALQLHDGLGLDQRRRRRRRRGRRPTLPSVTWRASRASSSRGGIVDAHLEEEAVELRLGQRIRALLLDRILRGEHHERLRGRASPSPSIVTCRSCMTSSSADCVLAGARLISSASRRFVKTGPWRVTNWPLASNSVWPTTSAGMRSGVNWMRAKLPSNVRASARTSSVLPRPGTPSSSTWPPASSAVNVCSTTLVLADDRLVDLVAKRADDPARGGELLRR